MATPQKSRWAWMSQAVASVESGLDRILADEEEASKKAPARPAGTTQENGTASRASSTDLKRSDSTNKTNDRLQARLAQAMAKNTPSRSATPQPASEAASRPDTPGLEKTETAGGVAPGKDVDKEIAAEEKQPAANALEAVGIPTIDVSTAESDGPQADRTSKSASTVAALAAPDGSSRPSAESARLSSELPSRASLSDAGTDQDAKLLNVQLEHETSLSTLQEEINGYLERIDALQRNLQILTKETIQSAKQVKADAESTPHDKQLAEKDEKIALLIEEGSKLTKGEMQYRNTIKKLRAQAATLTKDQEAGAQRAEKAEKSIAALEARATKAEAEAKRAASQIVTLSKSSSDVEAITNERNALQSTLAEVRSQLSRANKRAEEAESKAQSDKLHVERRKVAELQDDLSSAKVERQLAEDKLKREIEDLKQSLTREKEQARQMETEMLAEQAALESKLESFRVRAEEASAGDQSDSQAKLLRQIETLQSQYSAASQNWQGIETTLLARITALERERDEVVAREADLRRKLRDATTKAKNATRELDEVQQSLNALHDLQDQGRAEAQKATKLASELEDELAKLRRELDEQKIRAEKDMTRRLEEERARWMASLPQSISRVESPVASMRKAPPASFMDSLTSALERPVSRRSSNYPLPDSSNPPSRIHSTASVRANGASPVPEAPSIASPDDHDDFFANVPATPASATHADSAGRLNEVISASTAAAGPSVQLVERLSNTVRRLESEKAASKDELARLSSQRDEARQEVVNLMREVEQKRAAEERLAKLEKEHTELSEKHDRTLELLGEKSEQVEELKADVADVKQMYRHLADTMGKSST